jgi:hypothetical protein
MVRRKRGEKVWEPLIARGPQWARDARFGIFAHWGIYSVSGAWDFALPNEWALSFRITDNGALDKSRPDVDGSRMKLSNRR